MLLKILSKIGGVHFFSLTKTKKEKDETTINFIVSNENSLVFKKITIYP